MVLSLSSADEGVDLRSLRIESGEVTAWAKDSALIGADGEPIAQDTAVTSGGITVVVDMQASNLIGAAVHIHMGGFNESSGSITVTAKLQYQTNSYGHLLASVNN